MVHWFGTSFQEKGNEESSIITWLKLILWKSITISYFYSKNFKTRKEKNKGYFKETFYTFGYFLHSFNL